MSTSVIVRLYQGHEDQQPALYGVVEQPLKDGRVPFHNKDELWAILLTLLKEAQGETESEH